MEEKKANGRPLITTKDFGENWEKKVLSEYAQGAADIEIYRSILDICHDTFKRLMRDDSDFLETILAGREKSEAWWIRAGRVNLENRDFNNQLWCNNMRNRFSDKWNKDKEARGKAEGEATAKTFDQLIYAARNKIEEK